MNRPSSPVICVIGAGVIGLTTALRLLRAGYAVQVVARDFPPHTTSNLAAAVWYPFLVEPRARVREWARATRAWYEELVAVPEAGVTPIDLTILAPERLWWVDELAPDLWSCNQESARGAPAYRYVVQTFLVETPIFMRYLMSAVARRSGAFLQRDLHDLAAIAHPDIGAVVNCSGLGAAELVDDDGLYPVAGHIIPYQPQPNLPPVMDERVDELDTVCYLFPRRDGCIVGGSEVVGAGATVEPALVERIRRRAEALAPRLRHARAGRPYVGLRPGRRQVRLERDPAPLTPDSNVAVVHNYGHGGGGFTLCWGCADEVLRLLTL